MIKQIRRRTLHTGLLFAMIFAVLGTGLYVRSHASASASRSDLNNDGVVNIYDLGIFLSKFNSADSNTDFNNDGIVNIYDLGIFLTDYGKTSELTPMPFGVTGTWSLKFQDEFNDNSLDLNKWRPNWLADSDTEITKPVSDDELSCYDPAQVTEGGGALTITAVAKTCHANNGVTYNYASGLIESYDHYTFTYGYLEARIWIPPGSGAGQNWPAFWADGTGEWPITGELDVMEILEGKPCYHFHSPSNDPGTCVNMANAGGWHTFGANWQPGKVTYYYDGAQVGQITSGITSAPMYLIANLGVSNTEGTPPVTVPSSMKIDYIRVWQ